MIKYAIKIHKISTVDALYDAWKAADFKELLKRFDFENDAVTNFKELQDLLFMAITDKKPSEAARIVLDYKLSDSLNEGQINSLSYEMLVDKISEEYPVIGLHKTLFYINQLLHKAFNGKFPNAKATIVDFEITPKTNTDKKITNEIVLKCFVQNLDNHNLIKRLFGNQLNANEKFKEANDIIWSLHKRWAFYTMITSEYWMGKDEFLSGEFEANIDFFDED